MNKKLEILDEAFAKNIIHLDTKEHLTDEYNICITRKVEGKVRSVVIFWNLMYKVDLSTPASIIKASKLIKKYQSLDAFFEGYISALIDKSAKLNEEEGNDISDYNKISDRINDFLKDNLSKIYGFQAHFRVVSMLTTCKKLYAC